jgi:diguanylate cyclase (GGDEF)-like protein
VLVFGAFGYHLGRIVDTLQQQSETDPVTGLYNVRRLRQQLHTELLRAHRYQQPLALLLVDLDGLKRINDLHGHQAGDRALLHVAACIRRVLRATDIAARVGGDEFAVLAPQTDHRQAVVLARRLRQTVAAQEVGSIRTTVSVGVASAPIHGAASATESRELLAAADAALYAEKERGRSVPNDT